MFHVQGPSKQTCGLLAVFCGKVHDYKQKQEASEDERKYPFPELSSSGRLEVQTLINPTIDEFKQVLETSRPSIVYFQGQQFANEEEIGSLVWRGVDLSSPEAISGLFSRTLPTTVYLEIPDSEKLAEAVNTRGVPYVIYWKNSFSCYAACHFREALLSVVQSSCSHTWDAFQLAHASFRLYCIRNNHVIPVNNHTSNGKPGPRLLGEPPKINVIPVEKEEGGEEEESCDTLPAVKIHDDDVNMRFLVCGVPCTLDAFLLGSLEDGLNALLSIEIRGSKLHNRVSAPPPPLQAAGFSRGVVTMRCELSTCSSAHISLLVSGSAQTCFDDELLESHIKNELIEKSQLVHALSSEESTRPLSEPWQSASIACGATVFEVRMKVPTWASQVLRQLAPQVSFRSFVALGISCIQGSSVASFENDDAERLLFFCNRQGKELHPENGIPSSFPSWLKFPSPSRKRSVEPCEETKSIICRNVLGENGPSFTKVDGNYDKEIRSIDGSNFPLSPVRRKLKAAAMRPIPHARRYKMLPFLRATEEEWYDAGQAKTTSISAPSVKHNVGGATPGSHRKSSGTSYQAQQIISLNPLPLKKHGCDRSPIQVCSEVWDKSN